MSSISQRISKSSVSALTNCWKVVLHEKTFVVLPAHVAVFKQNDIWKRSRFLDGMNDLKWVLPKIYVLKQEFGDDFAWAEIKDSADSLVLNTETDISYPTEATFCFKQPYDAYGTITTPTFGAMKAVVYPSPGDGGMLEALNTGFRGMSGALAYTNEDGIVGVSQI